jgi:hypothetical protein
MRFPIGKKVTKSTSCLHQREPHRPHIRPLAARSESSNPGNTSVRGLCHSLGGASILRFSLTLHAACENPTPIRLHMPSSCRLPIWPPCTLVHPPCLLPNPQPQDYRLFGHTELMQARYLFACSRLRNRCVAFLSKLSTVAYSWP